MIKVSNLFKTYDEHVAVRNVSFEVKRGTTLVLLGTSGSGKTTTLKMINRLIEPTDGNIHISGQDIREVKPEELRRKIGYVSQNDGLFPHYTVEQNIAIVPRLLGWTTAKIKSETSKTMTLVLLSYEEFGQKYPHQLSGGQKQRVSLARAIITDPEVILMDEPFGALDPITRSEVRKEFGAIIRSTGKTTVLVTHDIAEAVELGDQIVLMNKGEIVQKGTPNDLILNPESQFVSDFIQDQSLSLALSVTPLVELWENFLPATNRSTQTVSANTSIWQSVNLIIKENLTVIDVENGDGEIRSTNLSILLEGYQKLRLKNG